MKTVVEILREFFLLGLTSFGGPTAHVAFFRDRFVGVKKWLSEKEFADLLALCQFLPGPASSQLGFAIGWKKGGLAGAFAAWLGFTIPSAVALILFGIGVMTFALELGDGAGWLKGLQIAVVLVIAKALYSMWVSLCPGKWHQIIAIVAAGVMIATDVAAMQLVVIAMGAVAGCLLFRQAAIEEATGLDEAPNPVRSGSSTRKFGLVCLVAFFVTLFGLPFLAASAPENTALNAFNAMYRSGSLVFGGGHVVLPLLHEEVVTKGLVDSSQFVAGYGATQAVPGPLFTFSAYLGSLTEGPGGPWGMGMLCLVGIFLPAWLLVLGVMPFWESVVRRPLLRAALIGTNAAVVGLLLVALINPVLSSALRATDQVSFLLFLLGTAILYLILKVPVWAVVILAGVAGWIFL